MIAYISGKLYRKGETSVIIDVNGVGYELFCPKNSILTLGAVGDDVSLEAYTHVNENAFQLFGFTSLREKKVFQKLISVSGIGPKLALAVLSDLPVTRLLQAIVAGDIGQLTRISGVGKKTAERIVVELKDKFNDDVQVTKSSAANDDPEEDARISDVTNALISLGYPSFHAKKVVNGLDVSATDSVQDLIKKSLGQMNR